MVWVHQRTLTNTILLGNRKTQNLPEVVDVGGESEEDLVHAGDIPQSKHEQQVQHVALTQQAVRINETRIIRSGREKTSGACSTLERLQQFTTKNGQKIENTHVSMRSKRMVFRLTFHAKKCSYRLWGLMVFKKSARKLML